MFDAVRDGAGQHWNVGTVSFMLARRGNLLPCRLFSVSAGATDCFAIKGPGGCGDPLGGTIGSLIVKILLQKIKTSFLFTPRASALAL